MASFWGAGAGADDDDEQGQDFYKPANDAVAVLIDARPSMFVTNASGEVLFDNALKVALELLKNKIMFSDRDFVGVYLWGTREKRNATGFEGVYELQPLGVASADRINELEKLLVGELDFQAVVGSQPAGQPAPLKDALWAVNMGFTQAKLQPQDHQRIWLFTADDEPNAGDAAEQDRAVQQARDCAQLNRSIHVWHQGENFDVSKFWTRVVLRPDTDPDAMDDDDDLADGAFMGGGGGNFEALMSRMSKKKFKKRRLCSLPLVLSQRHATQAAVAIYATVMQARPGAHTWIHAQSNAPIKTETRQLCSDTGAYLDPATDIRTYYKFGGKRVYLSPDDVRALKPLGGDPGLTLLGFKPRAQLQEFHNVRAPYFVYPDEAAVSGSMRALAALHGSMLRQGKMAIARFQRANAAPRLWALLPQVELEGDVDEPAGFYGIPLPFVDDLRAVAVPAAATAPPAAVDAAREMINSVVIEQFSPDCIENPALQKHYAGLQALALKASAADWGPDDDVLQPPDMADWEPVIRRFRDAYGGAPDDRMPVVGGKRKAAGSGSGSGSAAKVARPDITDASTDDDWVAICRSGAVAKLTLPVIKAFLKRKGLAVGGKKADLIERVKEALGVGAGASA